MGTQWNLVRGMKNGGVLPIAYGYIHNNSLEEVLERFREAGVQIAMIIEDRNDGWQKKRYLDELSGKTPASQEEKDRRAAGKEPPKNKPFRVRLKRKRE